MSARPDLSYEMPDEFPLDDALAPFAEEVRFAVSGPPPVPSAVLAAVLASGLSPTEKGDVLATAASNVHGPARQAAGLPNWKKEKRDVPVAGVLASLLAKLGCLGTATKAALAGVTAVTTMGLAGGAAGVLPAPAQNVVAAAVSAATPFEIPDADGVVATIERTLPGVPSLDVPPVGGVPGGPPVSATVGAEAGSTSASASASAKTGTPAGVANLPNVPNVTVPPLPSLPQVTVPPAVSGLVNGLPACVKNLVPTSGTPDPAKLATQIPGCITQVLSTANLPPEVARCVSAVLGVIGGASGMSAGSVPSVGSLNVSACVPMDVSTCVSGMLGMLGTLPGLSGGIPGIGSLPGMGSIPGLSTVTGCVPMDVTRCITSITSAVSAGTTPRLDLSACMPTTVPTGIPGLPTNLPGLGSLPGLAGALPFFGR